MESFGVLLVCTGNICRSPIAEQLLRARVEGDAVAFSSAGTGAYAGATMPEEAQLMSRRYGGDPAGHLSRPLDRALVAGSGLILTASRQHRAGVVELLPRASAYTYTLRQFARLLAAAPTEELASAASGPAIVALAARQRGYSRADVPDDDDVPDPYRGPLAGYEEAARLIDAAVATIAPALRQVR